jgi:uncharacterized repeat protein (TIGR02543 family)
MKKTIFTLVFALASVAVMASQTLVGWGDNSHGQLNLPAGYSGGIVDVATGHGNTILLKTDGTVVAWGYNPLGSCNVPANLSGVVKVSTFAHHCLALKGDGTVVAWGRNYDGESSVPAGLANVIGVGAGSYHSLAVKGDGTVVTWGSNYYGERDVPAGLSGVVAVTAGFCVSYAIKSDGTVVAWGLNASGQCNIPSGLTGVVAVGAGNSHAVALKANGTVVAWGNSADGRTSIPEGLSGVTRIAVVYDHTLALKSDGTVVAWGKTEHGECSIPSGLAGVTAIAAGAWHSVAIAGTLPPQVTVTFDTQGGNVIPSKVYSENAVYGTLSVPSKIGYTFDGWWSSITGGIKIEAAASVGTSSHTLYARWIVNTVSTNQVFVGWGDNTQGQLTLPTGQTGIVAVAAGHGNTVILKNNGRVAAWGYNPLGSCNVPANLSNVVKVATYAHHCLALKSDGKVVAWGRNYDGESNVPSTLSNVVGVAAGAYHSLALKSDGTVVAWGSNYNGERNVPAGLNGVVAIAAGSCTSLAVKSDGTVVNWGVNIGVPSNLAGVKALAVGTSHYVALKWDGTVVAWGNSADGRITVPEGLSGVIAIASIYEHTLALKSNGTVVAWGKNVNGECVVPTGLSGVTSIAAGSSHSVAVRGGTLLSTITVAFNSQGGTPVGSRSYIQDTLYGALPVVTRTGYTFAGWCIDAACSKQVSASDYVGAESHTLYAKWDSHGMLRFQKASYSIAENTDAAAVVLKVERVNGSIGPASVSYVVESGTATNGLDYASEVMTLSWAAGSTTARNIVIDMLDDDLYEGNETFTVRLVDATGAVLGDPAVATVTIVDNEGAPASMARFEGTLDFGSVARNSTATRIIKLWNEGNQPLAVTEVTVPEGFTVTPQAFTVRPGEFASLSVSFIPTVLGSFGGLLGIAATGNAGASSLPVSGAGVEPPRPVAQRTITGLTAIIAVDVPSGVNVLSVEDALAPGMVPLSISDGGTWDPINRKVKWFFDMRGNVRDRALQYTVANAGSVLFGQTSFGEGNSYPISGDTIFVGGDNPGLLHPADVTGDWRVDQSEIAASISRWKNAQENLKTSVAIRGITLYLQGEQYVYSAGVPAEAKRWIPAGDPLGVSADAPRFTAFSILQPGVVRNVQSNAVTLVITPPQGTRAYGMEEIVGTGVVAGSISHEGTWDPTSRKIRWAFYDGASRALSYTVSGPEGLRVTLTGLASFDGSEDGVTGAASAVVPLSFQTWAQSKGLAGAAAAFEARDLASGEANGLLYAFGSNLEEGESVIDILWQDGVLVIETPAQDPATEAFVSLTVEGASELGAPAWTISLEPAADQSSAPANRCRWIPLLPPPSSAFFRVKAILK